jgi:hypothetical protein
MSSFARRTLLWPAKRNTYPGKGKHEYKLAQPQNVLTRPVFSWKANAFIQVHWFVVGWIVVYPSVTLP